MNTMYDQIHDLTAPEQLQVQAWINANLPRLAGHSETMLNQNRAERETEHDTDRDS